MRLKGQHVSSAANAYPLSRFHVQAYPLAVLENPINQSEQTGQDDPSVVSMKDPTMIQPGVMREDLRSVQ